MHNITVDNSTFKFLSEDMNSLLTEMKFEVFRNNFQKFSLEQIEKFFNGEYTNLFNKFTDVIEEHKDEIRELKDEIWKLKNEIDDLEAIIENK